MSATNDTTTLVCLFHHQNQAEAVLKDLLGAGVPEASISVVGDNDAQTTGRSTLQTLGVPERDLKHLMDGVTDGGTIVAVSAISDHVDTVEKIFGKHQASKIDETETRDNDLAAAPLAAVGAEQVGERAIPIVEEQLEVGKRTVDQGGVRIFRRVVEIPAEESVNLREEHVVIERKAVDRAPTRAELDNTADRSIELTETAEEAVVGKTARVVEEVLVGKQTGEHTEHIRDTVRRTEVEIEELPATDTRTGSKNSL